MPANSPSPAQGTRSAFAGRPVGRHGARAARLPDARHQPIGDGARAGADGAGGVGSELAARAGNIGPHPSFRGTARPQVARLDEHPGAHLQRRAGAFGQGGSGSARGLEAQRLLVHSTSTSVAIGELLGFSEPTNFVKFFRRRVGTTPEAFRQAHRLQRR
ncbi:MAG: helix-turn-helix domain-containing protein [Burkholderiaceae bacterium]